MEEELGIFLGVCHDPYRSLGDLKKKGRKIVGCVPMHVPEEIVHASGIHPVAMWESNRPIGRGHALVQSFFCGLARGLVDDAVSGRLDFLDGIVLADSCLAVRGIDSVLRRNFPLPYYESLYLPPVLQRPTSREYVAAEFNRFKTSLESLVGHEITETSLRNSIGIYENDRRLLREVYSLRRRRPGVVAAGEVTAMVMSASIMPKEDHARLLEKLLPKLAKRSVPPQTGVKVVISGCLCQAPRFELLSMCEAAGAVVVDDDLYVGSRSFDTVTPGEGSAVTRLASRYLGQSAPCPTRIQSDDWGDYLVSMVKKVGAQGAINLVVKHCEPHEIYYPELKKKLAAAGVPELMIEVEHDTVSMAPLKTRVQAFVEMVGGV